MPLPPALLARLAKRGIVQEQAPPPQPKPGKLWAGVRTVSDEDMLSSALSLTMFC